ncbi:MAG: transporter [Actinomycetia bacterium]|nr:transporter [Actinomycetes bacterium]MDQ1654894.1 ATP-binding cassette, subfamily bacterial [Cryptosporangiaceae bacterium]MDQ1656553.1 ATP-binding cassette, subfamily bacterial [Cryptosporangiaceae bacterium]
MSGYAVTVEPMSPDPLPRSALANLWRIRSYVRPYVGQMVTMVAVSALGVGATIVIPLITRAVVDGPVKRGDVRGIVLLAALALAFGAGEAGMFFVRRWVQSTVAAGLENQIRNDLYAHLQRLPLEFHDQVQTGQLVSRATSDLSTIRRFLSFGLIFLIVNVATYLTVAGLLIQLYWPLGVLVAAGAGPLAIITRRFEARFIRVSRRIQDQQGDVATIVEESAVGVRAIKSFGRRRHVARTFEVAARQLHDDSLERARVVARFWPLFDIVPNALLAAVLLVGALAVGSGALTVGGLVAFVSLTLMLIWPVGSLGWLLATGQEAATAADRLYEVLDTKPSIVDRPGAADVPDTEGHLRIEGVGFGYPGTGEPVLHDVTLDVAPGETVALVGVTGSGKTTLTALVPRLYDVTAGRITLDGRDVRDFTLSSLRRLVSTAFEDPTLFSASVRENLTLGRPDASDEQVSEALRIAQAEFAYDLPWGLDTRIGEQGLSLSGGQRQRLALARAVLGRPRVLVLDDPLSALDVHTEALVEEALRRVLAGTTALLVVHRPSTVALADRVALLQDGTITAVGTHSELMATVPAYRAVLSATADEEEVPAR